MPGETRNYTGHTSMTTTNHNEIRRWAEKRDGIPAVVEGTTIIQIDFGEDGSDNNLEEISWDRFFQIFDDRGMAFIYDEATEDGEESRFFRLVSEDASGTAGRS